MADVHVVYKLCRDPAANIDAAVFEFKGPTLPDDVDSITYDAYIEMSGDASDDVLIAEWCTPGHVVQIVDASGDRAAWRIASCSIKES
jgi:hypothetical protein